jgi:hypothetical protein
LLIWTHVDSDEHGVQNAIFLIRNAKVGQADPINRAIYWHIDCVGPERLKPTVKVALLPRGEQLGQPVGGLLGAGGGIVSDGDSERPPEFPPPPGNQMGLENSIREALGDFVLPSYDVGGAGILADSGTHTFGPRGVAKGHATHEIEVSYRYTQLASPCAQQDRWNLIRKRVQEVRDFRRMMRATTDSDGDGHSDGEERACGSDPGDANSTPIYRRGRCVGVRHRRPRRPARQVSGLGSLTSVGPQALAFSVSFSQPATTFEIVLPGGLQVLSGQGPSGFQCRTSPFASPSDAFLCTGGDLAANAIAQGTIQTYQLPTPGVGGQLVGARGPIWFGPFALRGPTLPGTSEKR